MWIHLSAKVWPGVKSKIADKTLSCSALVSEENSLRRVDLESGPSMKQLIIKS